MQEPQQNHAQEQPQACPDGFSEAELANIRLQMAPDTLLNLAGLDRLLCRLTGRQSQAEAAALLFRAFDTNSDGGIGFDELSRGLWVLARGTYDEKGELMFRVFDVDQMGSIGEQETFAVIHTVYRQRGGAEHEAGGQCEHGMLRSNCKLCGAGSGIGAQSKGQHVMMKGAVDRIFKNHDRIQKDDFQLKFREFYRLLPPGVIPTTELDFSIEPIVPV